MAVTIDTILGNGESIKWRGRISRIALVAQYFVILLAFLGASYYFFNQGVIGGTFNGASVQISGATLGPIFLGIGLLIILAGLLSSLVVEYAVTDKRVIIKTGIIAANFKSVYFNEMRDILVQVGIVGKILSIGTIKIDTGKTNTYSTGGGSSDSLEQIRTETMYDNLTYINRPYEVYKIMQSSLI